MKLLILILAGVVLLQGFRIGLLKRSVTEYKNYWQKQTQITPAANAVWYVALGDSAAQGIGASSPTKGYVGLIASSLKEKYGKDVHVVNLSVTGAKVEDVIVGQLPQLQNLSLPNSAIVTIEVGANDMASFDANKFEKQYDQLLKVLPSQTIVADMPYFGGGIFRSREKSVLLANEIIYRLASKYHLRVAGLHQITKDRDSLFGYAADLFHPNNHAYRGWHDAFWQVLDK